MQTSTPIRVHQVRSGLKATNRDGTIVAFVQGSLETLAVVAWDDGKISSTELYTLTVLNATDLKASAA